MQTRRRLEDRRICDRRQRRSQNRNERARRRLRRAKFRRVRSGSKLRSLAMLAGFVRRIAGLGPAVMIRVMGHSRRGVTVPSASVMLDFGDDRDGCGILHARACRMADAEQQSGERNNKVFEAQGHRRSVLTGLSNVPIYTLAR